MPERLRLSGIWFLLFNLYRLPARSDILHFLRCHRFAPGVSATAHPSRCAVSCFDHCVISHRATWLCDKFHAALMCAFDVIGKREECVRAKGYIGQLV